MSRRSLRHKFGSSWFNPNQTLRRGRLARLVALAALFLAWPILTGKATDHPYKIRPAQVEICHFYNYNPEVDDTWQFPWDERLYLVFSKIYVDKGGMIRIPFSIYHYPEINHSVSIMPRLWISPTTQDENQYKYDLTYSKTINWRQGILIYQVGTTVSTSITANVSKYVAFYQGGRKTFFFYMKVEPDNIIDEFTIAQSPGVKPGLATLIFQKFGWDRHILSLAAVKKFLNRSMGKEVFHPKTKFP